jgi:hypothetical protein
LQQDFQPLSGSLSGAEAGNGARTYVRKAFRSKKLGKKRDNLAGRKWDDTGSLTTFYFLNSNEAPP